MIIKIKDQCFQLPINLREVAMDKGMAVEKYLLEIPKGENLTLFDITMILSILMDAPYDLLADVDPEQLQTLYRSLVYLHQQPIHPLDVHLCLERFQTF